MGKIRDAKWHIRSMYVIELIGWLIDGWVVLYMDLHYCCCKLRGSSFLLRLRVSGAGFEDDAEEVDDGGGGGHRREKKVVVVWLWLLLSSKSIGLFNVVFCFHFFRWCASFFVV